jgi:hypothetical protein
MQLVDALDRPIAFHRCFVTITGSITAALMLSQAVYWSKRSKDPEGWFYKTAEEWMEETGMTRSEQEDSRRRLIAYGFVSEVRKGMPAKLHYRVNAEAINLALTTNTTRPLTVDEVLRIFAGPLRNASKTGWMRAKKLGAAGAYVDYAGVLKTRGMTCSICGAQITKGLGQTEDSLCFDHILALNAGGTHTVDNLAPAHVKCNAQKMDGDGLASSLTKANQDRLRKKNESVYGKETSPSTVGTQDRLPKGNKAASGKEASSSTEGEHDRLPKANINRNTETTAEITTEITAESGADSPALTAIDELASLLCSLYQIPDNAGWRLKDKFQALAMELHGLEATPADVRDFYASRHKKPGVEFFAGDFVTWRASQNGAPAGGSRAAQRQEASAKAREILFGGTKR